MIPWTRINMVLCYYSSCAPAREVAQKHVSLVRGQGRGP